jgi:penicillin-binding protein 1A
MTGGGLPVEAWSRVMQAAHRGIPVAALPGTGMEADASTGALRGRPVPPEDLPPGDVLRSRTAAAARQAQTGIDGWLLDRLFGR